MKFKGSEIWVFDSMPIIYAVAKNSGSDLGRGSLVVIASAAAIYCSNSLFTDVLFFIGI